jgi:hypothetical protein
VIKQTWLFVVSLLALALAAMLGLRQAKFLADAEKAMGEVTTISRSNSRCGRKNHRYGCTEFAAVVVFTARSGQTGSITVPAGSTRGLDMPSSNADYRAGDTVPIIYDPDHMDRAYQNTTWGIWSAPLIALIVHLATLVGSMTERRERRRWAFNRR